MDFFRKSKSPKGQGSIKTRSSSRALTTPAALQLPEIQQRIFDFIDEYTLHHTVLLVCHQWFWANQHRIVRKLNWFETSKTRRLDKVISRLPRATHLVLHFAGSGGDSSVTSKLIQALSDNNTRQLKEQEQGMHGILGQDAYFQPTTSTTHHGMIRRTRPLQITRILRDLDLTARSGLLFDFLSSLGSLTALRVQLPMDDRLNVDFVLSSCPHLVSLRVESDSRFYLDVLDRSLTKPHSLQSFIVENATISQDTLGHLLTVFPRLKGLQLRNLRHDSNLAKPQVQHWSWLMEKLNALEISLSSVHFSVYGQPMQEEEVYEKIMMFTARSQELVLRSYDLTPVLTYCLRQLPNRITTLELVTPGDSKSAYSDELHLYLCSSPHLLHLKAPQSVCLLERMDIHGRWTDPSTTTTTAHSPGIWACRNLRTLHIRVLDIGPDSVEERRGRSRILFGYISRVLPHLEDLMLLDHDVHRSRISLDLQSGFCLLARLSGLETLRIGQNEKKIHFRAADLRWIVPSGHINGGRIERAYVFKAWDELLVQEAEETAVTNRSAHQQRQLTEDVELWKSLENLGLLLDVKVMVDEMEANKEAFKGGMKRLRDLAIYRTLHSRPTPPEKEYLRLASDNFELRREVWRDDIGGLSNLGYVLS
ncbi:hypothetical protein BGZ95_000916 [Linnemannia exigua]|uniref:F-box domain-containing protein n=1 Tax=Linnemannia exigua TaxID=604196 RepID=A0AAD4H407_9FUNG|nr:hypothetical protein BGZ95_000916 [Linnemannia exigua]